MNALPGGGTVILVLLHVLVGSAAAERGMLHARYESRGVVLASATDNRPMDSSARSAGPRVAVGGWPVHALYKLQHGEDGSIDVTADGEIVRARWTAPANRSQALQAPFTETRAIGPFRGSNEFLLAGWDPGLAATVMLRLRLGDWGAQPLEIVGSPWVIPGRDVHGMVWNVDDECLYCVDRLGGGVLGVIAFPASGAWPDPAAFEAIAFGAGFFDIARFNSDWQALQVRGPRQVCLWTKPGITHNFTLVDGQWLHRAHLRGSDVAPHYSVHSPTMMNSRGPLALAGPLGPFDVVDVQSQQAVLSASITIGGWSNFVVPPGALRSGRTYRIVGNGGIATTFIALERHGEPLDVLGTTAGVPKPRRDRNHVGSERFAVAAAWQAREGAATLPMSGTAYLWLAVTTPGQPDPVVLVDSNGDSVPDAAILSEAVSGPGRAKSLTEDMPMTAIADRLAIPNDPGLAGVKLWFQYLVVTPDAPPLVSEVTAVPIEAPEASAHSGPVNERDRERAVRRWLGDLRDETGQRVLEQTQARMVRGR